MKKVKYLVLPVILLALCFAFAGCDTSSPGHADVAPPPVPVEPVPMPYLALNILGTSTDGWVRVIISTPRETTTVPTPVLTPRTGDAYEVTLDGLRISRGAIEVVGSTFTFWPITAGTVEFDATFIAGTMTIPSIPRRFGGPPITSFVQL